MSKENKRKITIPFTLEQFKDAIERIKAEYNAGNLSLVGLFEIEALEYYYEKVKENEQVQKQQKLLKLYREKDKYTKAVYPLPIVELQKYRAIVKQIMELENE